MKKIDRLFNHESRFKNTKRLWKKLGYTDNYSKLPYFIADKENISKKILDKFLEQEKVSGRNQMLSYKLSEYMIYELYENVVEFCKYAETITAIDSREGFITVEIDGEKLTHREYIEELIVMIEEYIALNDDEIEFGTEEYLEYFNKERKLYSEIWRWFSHENAYNVWWT